MNELLKMLPLADAGSIMEGLASWFYNYLVQWWAN
jgi:hypothetical protein